MKKFKINLSVFMVLVIISISILPSFATSVVSTSQAIITDDLMARMDECSDDEKITVYLWYKDIDQNEVDALTTQATGLTREDCEVIDELPSAELLSSLESSDLDADSQMDAYLRRTEAIRDKERERTEIYAEKHREISNAKYNQKSQNIRTALSIADDDTEFSSQFAPLIIAEMTKDEIESASQNLNIDEISLYVEPEMVEQTVQSASTTVNLDKINSIDNLGLTGDNVKVGIIENSRMIFENDGEEELSVYIEKLRKENKVLDLNIVSRITRDQTTPTTITTDNGGVIDDYGNVAVIQGVPNPVSEHATCVAKTLFSVAPDIKIYSCDSQLENIETMISAGVNLINVSVGANPQNVSTYAYTPMEKWFDYIVANHGVTVFCAAGNTGDDGDEIINEETGALDMPGQRPHSPALAYNVISVGAYCDILAYGDNASPISEDTLYDYSAYKNSLGDNIHGCEKPDVVAPATFNGGGTSVASPFLAGIASLIYELKPSLVNQPHLMKSIVMASCHRKVKQYTEHSLPEFVSGTQEYINDGITERQGAGAPDAWTIASIVCQGTYGIGELTGADTNINVVQPPYGAENMNVSISWLRANTASDNTLTHVEDDDVVEGQLSNVNLRINHNDTLLKASSLVYSSTEMCYFPLSDTNYNYQIKLLNESVGSETIRYAYAWSTDNMRGAPISQDGFYHIRNFSSKRYATYNTASETPQAVQRAVSSQSAFSDIHQWIIQQSGTSYNIMTAYGDTNLYLGQNSTSSGSTIPSQLKTVAESINIVHNEDGTVSFFNSTNDRILTYSGSNLVWKTFSSTSTLLSNQKWNLEKVNYLRGDANVDGQIENTETGANLDVDIIQNYLSGLLSLNNRQRYLADVDRDGYISVMDASKIGGMSSNKYLY